MSYDNHDSMRISYGQYQGVSVRSSLSLKGNMLVLKAGGSYRSESDCYYEDEGLDCDNEHSNDSKPSYKKIKFCPFCGKELNSTAFEVEKTKEEIEETENKIEKIKHNIDCAILSVGFKLVAKDTEASVEFNRIFFDSHRHTNERVYMPLNELTKYGTLTGVTCYGEDPRYSYGKKYMSQYDPKKGITFTSCYGKEKGSSCVWVTEEQLNELVELGFCKLNPLRLAGFRKKQENLANELVKLQEKLSTLNKHLDSLK